MTVPSVSDQNHPPLISTHRGVGYLLAILAALTLLPLLNVGITTNDDMSISSLYHKSDYVWGLADQLAVSEGRFYFHLWLPVAACPYIFGSIRIAHAIGLAANLGAMLLIASLLRRAGSLPLASLGILFFLMAASNSLEHNLFSASPFVYSCGLCLIMSASLLETNQQPLRPTGAFISTALFFFGYTLINEAALIYAMIPGLYAIYTTPDRHWRDILRIAFRRCRNSMIAAILYIAIYIFYRVTHPPATYTGSNIAFAGFTPFLQVIYQYTISAFPGYLAVWHNPDVGALANAMLRSPLPLATGLAATLAFWSITSSVPKPVRFGPRQLSLLTVMAVLAILPQVPLAMTSKYVDWVTRYHSTVYYMTFFAIPCVAIICALAVIWVIARIAHRLGSGSGIAVKLVLASFVFALAAANAEWNLQISNDQFLVQKRWDMVDLLLRTPKGRSLPDNAIVIAPALFEPRALAYVPDWYWTRYFSAKLNRPITVATHLPAKIMLNSAPTFYLHLTVPTLDTAGLFLAQLEPTPDGSLRAVQEADAFIDAPDRDINILFKTCSRPDVISAIQPSTGTTMVSQFRIDTHKWVRIADKTPFYIDTGVLSPTDINMLTEDITLTYGPGFMGLERAGMDYWEWSTQRSELIITSRSQAIHKAHVTITLSSYLLNRPVAITMAEKLIRQVDLPAGGDLTVTFDIPVEPGDNRLQLSTPIPPPVTHATGETRPLTFAVHRPTIEFTTDKK